MIFFNDPVPQDDHVERAVRMAVAMRDRFAAAGRGMGKARLRARVRRSASRPGYATLGRIGFEGRYDYAAIGNVTILASRLSSQAEANQILLSPRAHAVVEGRVEVESIGELQLKGMSRPVVAANVVGVNGA